MNDRDIEYRSIVMVQGLSLDILDPAEYAAAREADLVIVSKTHKVIKDRYGVPGRFASPEEINAAVIV